MAGKFRSNHFDRVLCDVPCSTEVKLNPNDLETFRYWSVSKVKKMSQLQEQILSSAIDSLKTNGQCLYITCSYAPEENELVIDKILGKYDNVRCINYPLPSIINSTAGLTFYEKKLSDQCANCIRVKPSLTHGAMFIALLEKY